MVMPYNVYCLVDVFFILINCDTWFVFSQCCCLNFVLCCVVSCRVVLCCVVLCCVVSCRVVLCCVVLCCVVLCRVVSCRVVLCCGKGNDKWRNLHINGSS
jgi:hypothetical protein